MISLADQLAEARRELALRRQCYPRWITNGTLDAGDATYQLKVMEAIIATLVRLDHAQRQLPLFPTPQEPSL
jgi:hypothetical protein